jgi:deoxycytidylate deaminase
MTRPTWDEYWLGFAEQASKRSTCFRNKVGAVIVKDKEIVSTGYNGAPFYQPNCQEIGYCYRKKHQIKSGTNLELCRASGAHGEANAVTFARVFLEARETQGTGHEASAVFPFESLYGLSAALYKLQKT